MRATDFLFESPKLDQLKAQVIQQVKKTDDEELLDKIHTTLNRSGLEGRIAKAISHDDDASAYISELVRIIVDTPGTYEEKNKFIEGFPQGYIDVKRMLSGERVHFDDLIIGKQKDAPLGFVKKVFHALKRVSLGTEKGPGEFALAVMSPQIKIFGKGDLHIGNLVVELKASAGEDASSGGGRIGTSGWLKHQDVPKIIKKYFPDADVTKTLSLSVFGSKMLPQLPPAKRAACARELFGSIFEGKKADITPLVDAAKAGQDLNKPYVVVSYNVYQKSSGFDGIMLMNFSAEELKYFRDPAQMAEEIYNPDVALISSNEGFSGRRILPSVTLAYEKLEKVSLPGKDFAGSKKELKDLITKYAEFLVKSARVRDPQLIKSVADYISVNWDKMAPSTLARSIIGQFPQLRKRPATTPQPQATQTQAPVAKQPVAKPAPGAGKPAVKPVAPIRPAGVR